MTLWDLHHWLRLQSDMRTGEEPDPVRVALMETELRSPKAKWFVRQYLDGILQLVKHPRRTSLCRWEGLEDKHWKGRYAFGFSYMGYESAYTDRPWNLWNIFLARVWGLEKAYRKRSGRGKGKGDDTAGE